MAFLPQDLQNRVDAYRGNPEALQQRYAVSQELIDLLALQKIKSDKEAAARDMQMQLAQQQAAQGMPPTVGQKLEGEVTDMTKRDVVAKIAKTLGQQQQKRQANIQQLASAGIPQAPGAAQAMPTQAMAAGGIVAFEEGGSIDEKLAELDAAKEEESRLRRGLSLAGRRLNPTALEDFKAAQQRVAALSQEIEKLVPAAGYGQGSVSASTLRSRVPVLPELQQPSEEGAYRGDFEGTSKTDPFSRTPPQGIAQLQRPQPRMTAPAMRMPMAPAAPAPASAAPQQPDELQKLIMEAARGNPQAAAKAREEYQKFMQIDPKLAEQAKADYDRQRWLYESRLKPREGIDWEAIRAAAGAMATERRTDPGSAGLWTSALGAGAQGIAGLDKERRAVEEAYTKGLMDLSKGRVAEETARREKAYGAGTEAEKRAAELQRIAITGAVNRSDQALRERTSKLDRESRERIAEIEVEARKYAASLQAESNRIAREGQADNQALSKYTMAKDYVLKVTKEANKRFEDAVQMLRLKKASNKEGLNPQEQKMWNDEEAKRDLSIAAAERDILPVLSAAHAQFGVPSFKVLGEKQQ